jgi:hypothetical protein
MHFIYAQSLSLFQNQPGFETGLFMSAGNLCSREHSQNRRICKLRARGLSLTSSNSKYPEENGGLTILTRKPHNNRFGTFLAYIMVNKVNPRKLFQKLKF